MSAPRKRFSIAWWGREASPPPEAHGGTSASDPPMLLPPGRDAIKAVVDGRRAAFVPEWRPPPGGDAGIAVRQLFAEQAEPVVARLDRVPEKIFVEYLRTAGVEPNPPTPAAAMLEFTVSPAAGQSVVIPAGFQSGAKPAKGGDLVVFETDRELNAAPSKIAERHVQEGQNFHPLPPGDAPFGPFGREAKLGNALWIGLDGDVLPGPTVALGIAITAPPGEPQPVPAGGVAPLPVVPPLLLQWEVLGARGLEPAELVRDETGSLLRGGIIELRVPADWPAVRPSQLTGQDPLRWLRVRIVSGRYDRPPSIDLMHPNCVPSTAVRTIRDEVLEPVANADGRRFRLSQTPVLPGSLTLVVDEGTVGDLSSATAPQPLVEWEEVPDLGAHGPDDRVFVLDAGAGVVEFGDGRHGVRVPPGFRNVIARAYRVGGGEAGAVAAGAISTLLQSAPFVLGVTNPLPASGGSDEEVREMTLARGPQEIRARSRAVTLADYELLALRAEGAQVARVHAVTGLHPGMLGRPIPGLVGVLVIPPDRGQRPLAPDEGSLRAVAQFLATRAAPAGVTVIAGAVRYHPVRVEAQIIVAPTIDEGAAVQEVLRTLDAYLHPLTGGEDRTGWPFGGPIRYAALVRQILKVELDGERAIRAVPRLSLVVDGLRVAACQDQSIPAHQLPFPARHEIIPIDDGGQS
jgi:predicted phage baseplate assembly protein